MYYIYKKTYNNRMKNARPTRRDSMKTLGYIYGVIVKAMNGEIDAERALELIRAVLSI